MVVQAEKSGGHQSDNYSSSGDLSVILRQFDFVQSCGPTNRSALPSPESCEHGQKEEERKRYRGQTGERKWIPQNNRSHESFFLFPYTSYFHSPRLLYLKLRESSTRQGCAIIWNFKKYWGMTHLLRGGGLQWWLQTMLYFYLTLLCGLLHCL